MSTTDNMGTPLDVLRYHVSGAVERGEGEPITCEPVHYIYTQPIFNGLYTVGRMTSYCDRVISSGTLSRGDVTCPDCLSGITH